MKKPNNILFVVNPFAGVSAKKNFSKIVEKSLGNENIYYKIKYTEYEGHATEIANVGVREGADIIAAVGGDGTVNEVARALVNTDVALGIIPGGSGNGLSMHLGIGRNTNKALNHLKDPNFKVIDTCRFNGKMFLNIAGTGMDAQVAQRTAQLKHRGLFTYLLDTLKLSMQYRNQEYRVEAENEVREGKFLSVNIANGSMFGYNFVVAPYADVQDGRLQLVLMHHAPKWQYFVHSWRLLNKTIDKAPFVEILPVRNVQIKANSPQYFHIDGDGFTSHTNQFDVRVVPKSLKVVIP